MTTEFYMRPYIRFQPYMIGILFGYLLFKTNGKKIQIPLVRSFVLRKLVRPKVNTINMVQIQQCKSI